MLKLLKWDFRNFIHKYGWLYISLITTVIITALFPNHIRPFSSILNGLAAVYSLFFFGFTFLLSLAIPISWLRSSSSLLELSLPAKPWKILLSKITLAITINLTGFILTKLLWAAISRFGMSHVVLFNGLGSWLQYGVGMTTLIIIWLFSYILAKSFNFTRNMARISTTVFSGVICLVLIWFLAELFIQTGTWNVLITKPGDVYISTDKKIEWFMIMGTIIVPISVIVSGFFGSYKLLEQRYERY
jgi:hypothetical protein